MAVLESIGPAWASVNPEAFRAWIGQFGSAAPGVFILLYAINTVSLIPPIGILSLSAGLAFGPVVGFAAILAGAMIGTAATFAISRRLGRGFVERRLGGKFRALDERLERNGFATVLFFRLVPIVPYEPLNYLSGLSKIRFRDYWLASLLGLIPGAGIAALFGDSLTQPFSRRFFVALASLVVLIVVPVIYLKVRRNRDVSTQKRPLE